MLARKSLYLIVITSSILLAVIGCRKKEKLINQSSWQLQTLTSGGAVKDGHVVEFFGNGTFFIGGYSKSLYAQGVSWTSADNGVSWKGAYGNFEGQAIADVGKVNDSTAYILSSSMGQVHMVYTNDYFQNFSYNNLGQMCAPYILTKAIHFFNDSLGFVDDKRTENGGQSWECNTLPNSSYYDFINDSVGFACEEKDLLKTLDTGKIWLNIYSDINNLKEVKFFNELNGYLLTSSNLLKTTNGGSNWSQVATDVGSFFFMNQQEGFFTSGSKIFKTEDAGGTWELVFSTNKINFLDITCNGSTAIAVGVQLNAEDGSEYYIAISNQP